MCFTNFEINLKAIIKFKPIEMFILYNFDMYIDVDDANNYEIALRYIKINFLCN